MKGSPRKILSIIRWSAHGAFINSNGKKLLNRSKKVKFALQSILVCQFSLRLHRSIWDRSQFRSSKCYLNLLYEKPGASHAVLFPGQFLGLCRTCQQGSRAVTQNHSYWPSENSLELTDRPSGDHSSVASLIGSMSTSIHHRRDKVLPCVLQALFALP